MIAIMSKADYDKIKPIVLLSGVAIGDAKILADGKCAMCHSFTKEDITFLTEHGAVMQEDI